MLRAVRMSPWPHSIGEGFPCLIRLVRGTTDEGASAVQALAAPARPLPYSPGHVSLHFSLARMLLPLFSSLDPAFCRLPPPPSDEPRVGLRR